MSSTPPQPINMSESATDFTSHQQAAPISPQPESTTVMANTAPKQDNRPAYLDYKPVAYVASDRNQQCYRTYLDKLGFKEEKYTEGIRLNFVRELRAHVCAPETMHMRKEDNPAAFAALIGCFLQKYGQKYWGINRTHLDVTDISKGFFYPRDADREDSRFMKVLEELFQYKARCSRNNDANRPDDMKIVPHINFANLDPAEINSHTPNQGMSTIGVMRELRKIAEEAEGFISDDDDDDNSDAMLVDPLTRKRKRQSGKTTRSKPQYDNTINPMDDTVTESLASNLSGTEANTKNTRDPRESSRPEEGSFTTKGQSHPSKPYKSHKKIVRTPVSPVVAPATATPATADILTAKRLRNRNGSSVQCVAQTTDTLSNNMRTRAAAARAQVESGVIQVQDIASQDSLAAVSQTSAVKLEIKSEPLSNDITSKTALLVTATSQQDMAPVTVKLDTYTGSGFFEFLAEECELGNLSKKVTAISATYTWDKRKHRFRKERLDVDWAAFCDRLREAFDKNPDFAKHGCEVELLLHVVA